MTAPYLKLEVQKTQTSTDVGGVIGSVDYRGIWMVDMVEYGTSWRAMPDTGEDALLALTGFQMVVDEYTRWLNDRDEFCCHCGEPC